jgi:hypothetical protein
MAKSGCAFCSRITTVGFPTANAVVKSSVARADPPHPMTSSATHCVALRPRKNLRPSTTAGTEKRSKTRCSRSTICDADATFNRGTRKIPSVPHIAAPTATSRTLT